MPTNFDNLTFNELLGVLLKLPQEQQDQVLAYIQQGHPDKYQELALYFKANPGFALEAFGYEPWLRKMGPHTFTGSFAWFHHDFWKWYWPLAFAVRDNAELDLNDLVCLVPWSRDTGKSSHTEWAAICEGAVVRKGYVLWVCAKQQQAIEHVTSIRNRIEDEHVGKFYPWLGKPKVGAHGNKFGWGKDFLMTAGNWAVRPAGLEEYLRGGKILDMRPTLIVLSDVDESGDSPAVVENKENMIARSILPMGGPTTRIIFDQNPIHANSVQNRILTRTSSLLAVRRVIGINGDQPVPAFTDIEIEFQQTEHGPRHIIVGGSPTWPDMDMKKCQVFLDRSGIEAFMSEYQHDLTIAQEERVLPEYDDRVLRRHVITWSQYEAMYKQRRIPSDWPCDVGLDIGYSTGHKSAWTFLTKAPQFAPLAGSVFRYRGCTFTGVSIDEQAVIIRSELWPKEQIMRQRMSHEKLGERILLAEKHDWFFQPCDSSKTAGIPQWRHFLRPDRSQPHPFHRDEKQANGLWKLGRPAWFDVVDDDQFIAPRDDKGLKRHRDGAYNWRQVPVKLTDKGFTVEQPAKMDDDENDSCRMLTDGFGPIDQPLTQRQKLDAIIPQGYHADELQQRLDPNTAAMTSEFAEWIAKRTLALKKSPLYDQWGQPVR